MIKHEPLNTLRNLNRESERKRKIQIKLQERNSSTFHFSLKTWMTFRECHNPRNPRRGGKSFWQRKLCFPPQSSYRFVPLHHALLKGFSPSFNALCITPSRPKIEYKRNKNGDSLDNYSCDKRGKKLNPRFVSSIKK